MKSTFTDSRTGIRYELQGGYYLPCLKLPENDDRAIGIWGQRRRRYLKEHHRILYYNLLTKGKLHTHLADVNEETEEMFIRLVQQLRKKYDVTEQLKTENQLLWVQKMNDICNCAIEVVNRRLIYV